MIDAYAVLDMPEPMRSVTYYHRWLAVTGHYHDDMDADLMTSMDNYGDTDYLRRHTVPCWLRANSVTYGSKCTCEDTN